MQTLEPFEIIDTIQALNENILKSYPDKEADLAPQFEYRTNSYVDLVYFMHDIVWNSDDDDREFYEDSNEYEPLIIFLERKMKQWINFLKRAV